MEATSSCSLRAKIMIFNVFLSKIGNITHEGLKPVSCPMKLNSYASNTVSTEALRTEMSLQKVLIPANTALGLNFTVRLKLGLTTENTGETWGKTKTNTKQQPATLESDVPALSHVTTALSPKSTGIRRK